MPILTGSHPKALSGPYSGVAQEGPANEPLINSIDHDIPKANKKPPKIKKRAFGDKHPGAAFRK